MLFTSKPAHVTTQPALGAEASAWDALVELQPIPSPFLRSWWLEGAAGHKPCFVLVRDEGNLIGGLALEEDRRLLVPRLLAVGSALAPDHLDLVAAPGREDDVIRALANWFRRKGSRVVDLCCLVEHPQVVRSMPSVDSVEVVEAAPWTPLPSDFDSYMAQRPSRLNNSLDRTRRRLSKEGARYHRVEPTELEPALRALRALHEQVFGERSLFLPYFERFATVARAGMVRGELVLHQLRLDDKVIASDVTFEVAGRVSYYQSGRDTDRRWRGAGVYLEYCILKDACRRGFQEFDHLRGKEQYKREWAPHTRPLTRVVATHGPLGRATLSAFELGTRPTVVKTVRRLRNARFAVVGAVGPRTRVAP